MMEGNSKGEEEHASKRSRVCECGRDAVEKVVGPRSANRGLRYRCCDAFVLFGKKKNSCRFFEWIDQPRISKEQKKEAQALKPEGKGAASDNRDLLQPALQTWSVERDLEKQCKTIEGLQVNKENFELEKRVCENDPPQTQVGNALIDSPIASQHGLTAYYGADIFVENVSAAAQMTTNNGFLAERLQTSVQPETGRCQLNATLQQKKAVVQDVQGLNLSVDDTIKGSDTSVTQIGEGPKDKDTNQEGKQSLENASEFLETPTCLCLRAAVLKTAKSKGPNQGLQFWVCSNSRPFYMKKNKANGGEGSCKFFRWIDQPRISKEQKREAQALKREGKGAASNNRDRLQPAPKTRSVVRDLEKQCKTIEGLQVNKENFELEIRVSENNPPQTQVHKDVGNALIDSPIASQHGLTAYYGADIFVENASAAAQTTSNDGFLAEHLQSSLANAVQPETGRCQLNATLQQDTAVIQDVQGLNLSVDDTIKGADTGITQIGEGLKDKDTNQEGKQSLENASEFLETPTCLCLRAAVLKTASKGPNQGLQFWVCSNSRPFYMKKNKANGGEESCKFFRWVVTPLEKSDTQKNEENQKRKARKRKELSLC